MRRSTAPTRLWLLNCTADTLTAIFDAAGQADGGGAGLPQHPFADRHDQAGLLGQTE